MTGSVALPQYNTDLDPAYYQPKPEALDFLHKTISSDDEEVKTRVFQAQKEFVSSLLPLPSRPACLKNSPDICACLSSTQGIVGPPSLRWKAPI
ncbi:hypothetical protein DL93DRAFT_2073049 [Clavulina sp. PMI_390]|nr:hypothetical protein DL93DRAFT_2073049 [Clavulina sp. PMI_390]